MVLFCLSLIAAEAHSSDTLISVNVENATTQHTETVTVGPFQTPLAHRRNNALGEFPGNGTPRPGVGTDLATYICIGSSKPKNFQWWAGWGQANRKNPPQYDRYADSNDFSYSCVCYNQGSASDGCYLELRDGGGDEDRIAWGKYQYDKISYETKRSVTVLDKNLAITTPEDSFTTFLLNGNITPISFLIKSAPNADHGNLSSIGKTATFKPNPNWNGTTSFTYQVTDGSITSSTETITITVTPVNDTPSVSNATLTIDEDTDGTLTLDITDVDLQYEGDSHTWSIVDAPNTSYGSASFTNNKLTFTPAKDWHGTTTMTYQARDSKGASSNIAKVTVNVMPINDAPATSPLSLYIAEDYPGTLALKATDIDSIESFVFQIVSHPPASAGFATLQDGMLTFHPAANWHGKTSLTYRAQDKEGAWSSPSTIAINVTPVNDSPVVKNQLLIRTIENMSKTISTSVAR